MLTYSSVNIRPLASHSLHFCAGIHCFSYSNLPTMGVMRYHNRRRSLELVMIFMLVGFSINNISTNWHWHGFEFISIKTASFTLLLSPGDAVMTKPAIY